MPYCFAIKDEDYTDLSAGRVLYSLPGHPAFPVRLASEIFQRASALIGSREPITIFDPTCGGAYHLAALGFLHGEAIASILASDTDPSALSLAERNLSLLSDEGLSRREQEIRANLAAYGKESHAGALDSLARLRAMRTGRHSIATRLFQANVFDRQAIESNISGPPVRLVFSDIPYGRMTGWQSASSLPEGATPLWTMLETLHGALDPSSIVAIAADKSQKIAHEGYRRLERFQVGRRQVSLLVRLPD